MKTRYKLFVAIIIVVVGFFSFPPILTSVCNSLEIYDDTCPRISGIQIPFGEPVYLWNTAPPLPNECWVLDDDGNKIPCRIEDSWPFTTTPDEGCEEQCDNVPHFRDTDAVTIEGKMAKEICQILGGACAPFYPGNVNQNGSITVGQVVVYPDRTEFYQFLIQNDTLSYTKDVKENEN